MIRFSRRTPRWQQAVRILSVGVPIVALLHEALRRDSLWQSDSAQRLNRVAPLSMNYYSALPGLEALSPGWSHVLLLALYLLSTAWVGWKVLESLFPKVADSTHWLMRLAAGFIPGYLVVVAWNRGISALLPNHLSPWVSWFGLLAAASYFAALRGTEWLSQKSRSRWRIESFTEVFFAFFAVFYALVDGVQMNGHALSGDGAERFISYLANLVADPQTFARMPWVDQHYDELAFLHPVALLLGGPQFPVLIFFWVLASLGRLSSIGLAHFLARTAGLNGAAAFLLAAFLWLGTFSIYPLDYLIAFDSHNPFFYTLHIGRIASDLIPILIWLAVFSRPTASALPLRTRQILWGLFAAGVTALSFHAAALCALVAGLAVRVRRGEIPPSLRAMSIGWGIGLLFGGNLLCMLIWKKTGMVTSLWLPGRSLFGDPNYPFQFFPAGDALLATFNQSLSEFLRYFAAPLGLAALALVEGPRGLKDRLPILLALGTFVTALAAVSLIQVGIRPWYLSRLYEPSFYALLFFSSVRLFQCRNERIVLSLSILLVIYTFPVFFASHRPTQWADNFTHSYQLLWSRFF